MDNTTTMRLIEVEASMCLWEALIDMVQRDQLPADLDEIWGDVGSGTIRWACITAGAGVDALWQQLTEDERENLIPFDWSFCPLVARLSTFDSTTDQLVLPTITELRAHLIQQSDR